MKFDPEDVMTCAECGKNTLRRSPMQKYCTTCSSAKDAARKPTSRKQTKRAELVEIGAAASAENQKSIAWGQEYENLHTLVRVAVPFSYGHSKNAIWSMAARQGHVYARKESNELRKELTERIRNCHATWFEGKVWVDIFVEKPNARGDAVNVIDLVCDAIKDAIGVDDRWFSIRRLDWSIVKENPRLIVGIGQEVDCHHRACSYCGSILPMTKENFTANASDRFGFGRECKSCRSTLGKSSRLENRTI